MVVEAVVMDLGQVVLVAAAVVAVGMDPQTLIMVVQELLVKDLAEEQAVMMEAVAAALVL
jgi:hypothetical protein